MGKSSVELFKSKKTTLLENSEQLKQLQGPLEMEGRCRPRSVPQLQRQNATRFPATKLGRDMTREVGTSSETTNLTHAKTLRRSEKWNCTILTMHESWCLPLSSLVVPARSKTQSQTAGRRSEKNCHSLQCKSPWPAHCVRWSFSTQAAPPVWS